MSNHNERACTHCGSFLHHDDECSHAIRKLAELEAEDEPTPMTTDHTETPETSVKHCRTEYLRWWLNPDRKPPEPPNGWDVAEKMEQELTQARAALATAMEERDEARNAVVISQLDLLKAKETVAELHGKWDESIAAHSTARREKEEAERERDALRARNDALTKAIRTLAYRDSTLIEMNQIGPDEYSACADGEMATAEAPCEALLMVIDAIARRALGKEGK